MLPSLAVAAVLGIGGVSAGAALSGNGHHSSPLPRPLPSLHATSAPSPTAASPAATAPPTARPAALPDFAITVTGRVSWVGVVGPHGTTLYAGLLRHGKTLSYAQRPLAVTLGDAGAVRLVLHHRAHARAWRPGQVVQFTVR